MLNFILEIIAGIIIGLILSLTFDLIPEAIRLFKEGHIAIFCTLAVGIIGVIIGFILLTLFTLHIL